MGHSFSGVIRAGLMLAAASLPLAAQVDPVWDDRGEVSIFTGMAFGQTGTHPTVGGSTGVFVNKYAALLIGSTFVPLGNFTIVPYVPFTRRSRLYDSNFTLDVQIPIKRRWAPYGLLSTALLYNTFLIQRVRDDGTLVFVGDNDVKFGFEFGGGVRYSIQDDWGIKGEYRYTVSTHNFSRLAFGVFYRLPSNWPFLPKSRRKCRTCTY